MHYVDEGAGRPGAAPARRTDLGVPVPQGDSPTHRRARCIAPDYFGFGRSDKPTDRECTRTTGTCVDRAVRPGPRPARHHARRAGLGRPGRVRLRRRRAGARRAPRRPEHGYRRAGAERRMAAVPGVHAAGRHRHRCRAARAALARPTDDGRRDRRVRRAVPRAGGAHRDRVLPRARRDGARTIRPRGGCSTCATGSGR